MSKKTILFTLAMSAAIPALAAQGDFHRNPAQAAVVTSDAQANATTAVKPGYTVLREAQIERKTADDYAPRMRSVYFGH